MKEKKVTNTHSELSQSEFDSVIKSILALPPLKKKKTTKKKK